MEEPYRADPDPAPPPVRAPRWWHEAEWPSYEDTKDGIAYVGLLMCGGVMLGMMAASLVARGLGRVGKDGYADPGFCLGGLFAGPVIGLVVGLVSVVWGTSRLRWAVVLGSLLAAALMVGGQSLFPPHP